MVSHRVVPDARVFWVRAASSYSLVLLVLALPAAFLLGVVVLGGCAQRQSHRPTATPPATVIPELSLDMPQEPDPSVRTLAAALPQEQRDSVEKSGGPKAGDGIASTSPGTAAAPEVRGDAKHGGGEAVPVGAQGNTAAGPGSNPSAQAAPAKSFAAPGAERTAEATPAPAPAADQPPASSSGEGPLARRPAPEQNVPAVGNAPVSTGEPAVGTTPQSQDTSGPAPGNPPPNDGKRKDAEGAAAATSTPPGQVALVPPATRQSTGGAEGRRPSAIDPGEIPALPPPPPMTARPKPEGIIRPPASAPPRALEVRGRWRQTDGSTGPDFLPGGYTTSTLVFRLDGLLEICRTFGKGESLVQSWRVGYQWSKDKSTLTLGEDAKRRPPAESLKGFSLGDVSVEEAVQPLPIALPCVGLGGSRIRLGDKTYSRVAETPKAGR